MAIIRLYGVPIPVDITPGYTLEAPGVEGTVWEGTTLSGVTRSAGNQEALERALASADVYTLQQFEIEIDTVTPLMSGGETRSNLPVTTDGEPAMVLRTPDLSAAYDYAVLYTDELGAHRWLLPVERPRYTLENTRGGEGEIVFHLPLTRPSPPLLESDNSADTRGWMMAGMRCAVRVVAWATDDIIGAGAQVVARRWEEHKRGYGFVRPNPEQGGAFQPLQTADWANLGGGRWLLLLHGTFTTAEATFNQFVTSLSFASLWQAYEGRVIAFNHPSMHHSPSDNLTHLLHHLPSEMSLEVDLLTHSRGGLVGRELAERHSQQPLQRDVQVRRAIFVAAPHQGTILTDGDNWISFIDRYTNLLLGLPDTIHTITMEGVLIALKLLAHGALRELPGLHSMVPQGEYMRQLNSGTAHNSTYYAISADFTPTHTALQARFYTAVAERLIDSLFGESNDLVVPTRGSFEAGLASPGFPIPRSRRRLFDIDTQVHHCNYFAHPAVNQQIGEWLLTDK